jgi:hypothetical protein
LQDRLYDAGDYGKEEEKEDEEEEKRNVKLRRRTDIVLIFYLEELCWLISTLFCELLYSDTVNRLTLI